MARTLSSNIFRLGSHSTLFWGKQSTSYFFSFRTTLFNYVLIRFFINFFRRKHLHIVEIIFNNVDLRVHIFIILFRLYVQRRRKHVSQPVYNIFFRRRLLSGFTRYRSRVVHPKKLQVRNYFYYYLNTHAFFLTKFRNTVYNPYTTNMLDRLRDLRLYFSTGSSIQNPSIASSIGSTNSVLSTKAKDFQALQRLFFKNKIFNLHNYTLFNCELYKAVMPDVKGIRSLKVAGVLSKFLDFFYELLQFKRRMLDRSQHIFQKRRKPVFDTFYYKNFFIFFTNFLTKIKGRRSADFKNFIRVLFLSVYAKPVSHMLTELANKGRDVQAMRYIYSSIERSTDNFFLDSSNTSKLHSSLSTWVSILKFFIKHVNLHKFKFLNKFTTPLIVSELRTLNFKNLDLICNFYNNRNHILSFYNEYQESSVARFCTITRNFVKSTVSLDQYSVFLTTVNFNGLLLSKSLTFSQSVNKDLFLSTHKAQISAHFLNSIKSIRMHKRLLNATTTSANFYNYNFRDRPFLDTRHLFVLKPIEFEDKRVSNFFNDDCIKKFGTELLYKPSIYSNLSMSKYALNSYINNRYTTFDIFLNSQQDTRFLINENYGASALQLKVLANPIADYLHTYRGSRSFTSFISKFYPVLPYMFNSTTGIDVYSNYYFKRFKYLHLFSKFLIKPYVFLQYNLDSLVYSRLKINLNRRGVFLAPKRIGHISKHSTSLFTLDKHYVNWLSTISQRELTASLHNKFLFTSALDSVSYGPSFQNFFLKKAKTGLATPARLFKKTRFLLSNFFLSREFRYIIPKSNKRLVGLFYTAVREYFLKSVNSSKSILSYKSLSNLVLYNILYKYNRIYKPRVRRVASSVLYPLNFRNARILRNLNSVYIKKHWAPASYEPNFGVFGFDNNAFSSELLALQSYLFDWKQQAETNSFSELLGRYTSTYLDVVYYKLKDNFTTNNTYVASFLKFISAKDLLIHKLGEFLPSTAAVLDLYFDSIKRLKGYVYLPNFFKSDGFKYLISSDADTYYSCATNSVVANTTFSKVLELPTILRIPLYTVKNLLSSTSYVINRNYTDYRSLFKKFWKSRESDGICTSNLTYLSVTKHNLLINDLFLNWVFDFIDLFSLRASKKKLPWIINRESTDETPITISSQQVRSGLLRSRCTVQSKPITGGPNGNSPLTPLSKLLESRGPEFNNIKLSGNIQVGIEQKYLSDAFNLQDLKLMARAVRRYKKESSRSLFKKLPNYVLFLKLSSPQLDLQHRQLTARAVLDLLYSFKVKKTPIRILINELVTPSLFNTTLMSYFSKRALRTAKNYRRKFNYFWHTHNKRYLPQLPLVKLKLTVHLLNFTVKGDTFLQSCFLLLYKYKKLKYTVQGIRLALPAFHFFILELVSSSSKFWGYFSMQLFGDSLYSVLPNITFKQVSSFLLEYRKSTLYRNVLDYPTTLYRQQSSLYDIANTSHVGRCRMQRSSMWFYPTNNFVSTYESNTTSNYVRVLSLLNYYTLLRTLGSGLFRRKYFKFLNFYYSCKYRPVTKRLEHNLLQFLLVRNRVKHYILKPRRYKRQLQFFRFKSRISKHKSFKNKNLIVSKHYNQASFQSNIFLSRAFRSRVLKINRVYSSVSNVQFKSPFNLFMTSKIRDFTSAQYRRANFLEHLRFKRLFKKYTKFMHKNLLYSKLKLGTSLIYGNYRKRNKNISRNIFSLPTKPKKRVVTSLYCHRTNTTQTTCNLGDLCCNKRVEVKNNIPKFVDTRRYKTTPAKVFCSQTGSYKISCSQHNCCNSGISKRFRAPGSPRFRSKHKRKPMHNRKPKDNPFAWSVQAQYCVKYLRYCILNYFLLEGSFNYFNNSVFGYNQKNLVFKQALIACQQLPLSFKLRKLFFNKILPVLARVGTFNSVCTKRNLPKTFITKYDIVNSDYASRLYSFGQFRTLDTTYTVLRTNRLPTNQLGTSDLQELLSPQFLLFENRCNHYSFIHSKIKALGYLSFSNLEPFSYFTTNRMLSIKSSFKKVGIGITLDRGLLDRRAYTFKSPYKDFRTFKVLAQKYPMRRNKIYRRLIHAFKQLRKTSYMSASKLNNDMPLFSSTIFNRLDIRRRYINMFKPGIKKFSFQNGQAKGYDFSTYIDSHIHAYPDYGIFARYLNTNSLFSRNRDERKFIKYRRKLRVRKPHSFFHGTGRFSTGIFFKFLYAFLHSRFSDSKIPGKRYTHRYSTYIKYLVQLFPIWFGFLMPARNMKIKELKSSLLPTRKLVVVKGLDLSSGFRNRPSYFTWTKYNKQSANLRSFYYKNVLSLLKFTSFAEKFFLSKKGYTTLLSSNLVKSVLLKTKHQVHTGACKFFTEDLKRNSISDTVFSYRSYYYTTFLNSTETSFKFKVKGVNPLLKLNFLKNVKRQYFLDRSIVLLPKLDLSLFRLIRGSGTNFKNNKKSRTQVGSLLRPLRFTSTADTSTLSIHSAALAEQQPYVHYIKKKWKKKKRNKFKQYNLSLYKKMKKKKKQQLSSMRKHIIYVLKSTINLPFFKYTHRHIFNHYRSVFFLDCIKFAKLTFKYKYTANESSKYDILFSLFSSVLFNNFKKYQLCIKSILNSVQIVPQVLLTYFNRAFLIFKNKKTSKLGFVNLRSKFSMLLSTTGLCKDQQLSYLRILAYIKKSKVSLKQLISTRFNHTQAEYLSSTKLSRSSLFSKYTKLGAFFRTPVEDVRAIFASINQTKKQRRSLKYLAKTSTVHDILFFIRKGTLCVKLLGPVPKQYRLLFVYDRYSITQGSFTTLYCESSESTYYVSSDLSQVFLYTADFAPSGNTEDWLNVTDQFYIYVFKSKIYVFKLLISDINTLKTIYTFKKTEPTMLGDLLTTSTPNQEITHRYSWADYSRMLLFKDITSSTSVSNEYIPTKYLSLLSTLLSTKEGHAVFSYFFKSNFKDLFGSKRASTASIISESNKSKTPGVLFEEINFFLEGMCMLRKSAATFTYTDFLLDKSLSFEKLKHLSYYGNTKNLGEIAMHKDEKFKHTLRRGWAYSNKLNPVSSNVYYLRWLRSQSSFNFFLKFLKLSRASNSRLNLDLDFGTSVFLDKYFFNYFRYFKVFKAAVFTTGAISSSYRIGPVPVKTATHAFNWVGIFLGRFINPNSFKLPNLHRYASLLRSFKFIFNDRIKTIDFYTELWEQGSSAYVDSLFGEELRLQMKNLIYFKTMHTLSQRQTFLFASEVAPNLVVPNLLFKNYLFSRNILQYKPHGLSNVFSTWLYQKYQILRLELFLELISGTSNLFKLELISARSLFFSQRASLDLLVSSTFNRSYVQSAIIEFTKNFTHLLWYSIKLYNMNAAVMYFAQEFYARPRQSKVTRILEKIFKYSTFSELYFHGLVFQISGKLGRRSPRKRVLKVLHGLPPKFSSYRVRINYTYQQAISNFGAYGVKAWLYY